MKLTLSEIKEAQNRLKGIIRHTQNLSSRTFSEYVHGEVLLKCENHQKTGSFKIRGASNKIAKIVENGVKDNVFVTASAGNHAQGVAYSAAKFNYKSKVIMPSYAPLTKAESTKRLGADVELVGECFDDAYEYAVKLPGIFIHPYDDIDVIAGQGTIGLEILDNIPDVDIIIVPAGGGGLLAGVSFAVKQINPKVKVLGVQADNANAIVQSFKNKSRVCTESASTIADGIAVKKPGKITMELINKYVDNVISVSDNDIAESILYLLDRSKLVVEPAGATSVAALLNKNINYKNKKIVCLLSGGNIDMNTIGDIIQLGLVSKKKRVEFNIKTTNSKQSVKGVFDVFFNTGANIIYYALDKMSSDCDISHKNIYICCETKGENHCKEISKQLLEKGYVISEFIE